MTGPVPCWPSLRYLTRLGFTSPLLDPAAAAAAPAAGAAFLLGPAAAASALRFGAELIAVRLRLREGKMSSVLTMSWCCADAEV